MCITRATLSIPCVVTDGRTRSPGAELPANALHGSTIPPLKPANAVAFAPLLSLPTDVTTRADQHQLEGAAAAAGTALLCAAVSSAASAASCFCSAERSIRRPIIVAAPLPTMYKADPVKAVSPSTTAL